MSWLRVYLRSSIGKKHIMAITGLAMALFTLVHMAGHLIMFSGQEAYNTYAHNLQSLGPLKWIARAGLFAVLMAHFSSALSLSSANSAARPVKYAMQRTIRTTGFAKTMLATGLSLFLFIIFHILHFTVQVVPNAYWHKSINGKPDVFNAFVSAFQNPIFTVIYVALMGLLCMHLAHGVSSAFQSLGVKHPKYDPLIAKLGPGLGVLIFLGFIAPPLAAIAGVIKLA